MLIAPNLPKMDVLDNEKPRPDEAEPKSTPSAAPEKATDKDGDAAENTTPAAPPLRPLTRSLTGRASKPRPRDDSWYEAPKPRKKAKTAPTPNATRKRTRDDAESEDEQDAPAQGRRNHYKDNAPPPPPPPVAPEPVAVPPLNGTQAVFVDVSMPIAIPASASGPMAMALDGTRRTRTNLPVPVPNLIKKSRGRRVPVVASAPAPPAPRRPPPLVEGCGKCFHRGEHLKRHIRSIHTHEKRKLFRCSSLSSLFCESRANAIGSSSTRLVSQGDPFALVDVMLFCACLYALRSPLRGLAAVAPLLFPLLLLLCTACWVCIDARIACGARGEAMRTLAGDAGPSTLHPAPPRLRPFLGAPRIGIVSSLVPHGDY
ncbi:hypothetical protein C8F04DRAFT_1344058 [Mycena alexandri]|uniref:C2H2-type domain-containing protein n=1 Tax=Mycena alexandri TaxID=1745969 RepID=A0AAD6TH73_9AGAR|nr:hypothetical protein C8F04DRAFT_1344058 [Mycena alexandri]